MKNESYFRSRINFEQISGLESYETAINSFAELLSLYSRPSSWLLIFKCLLFLLGISSRYLDKLPARVSIFYKWINVESADDFEIRACVTHVRTQF